MKTIRRLIETNNDYAVTVVRLVLGTVFLAHGAQLILGCFGGPGFHGAMDAFTQKLGIPAPFAFLAIVAQFFGALMLILGLFGRLAAAGIFCVMAVAVLMVHRSVGFFMNWYGQQKGEGFEYHLLALALCLIVLVKGSGALSLDRWVARQLKTAS